ncbi:MAG: NAD(P)-dependent oxidoreductase [Candidatus Paceibacterota bacterium]|jgi:UDP-glucose 4-epimerase
MNIGITGSGGFIGSAVYNRLISDSDFNVKTFEGDILNIDKLNLFISGCDVVIHLAGVFSNDFEQLFNVNFKGTRNVVEVCKKYNIKKLVFSSTGAVYGEPLNGVSSFEFDLLSPNTLYGLSKFYAEEYIRFSGINCTILRFSNVYGPNNNKGVLYNFLDSIKNNGKAIIFGDGNQKRNFLYIDDAVDAIYKVLRYDGKFKIFNIADSELYTLNNVLRKIKNAGLIFEVEYRQFDENNKLDVLSENINLSMNELRWIPTVSLDIGIKKIL